MQLINQLPFLRRMTTVSDNEYDLKKALAILYTVIGRLGFFLKMKPNLRVLKSAFMRKLLLYWLFFPGSVKDGLKNVTSTIRQLLLMFLQC